MVINIAGLEEFAGEEAALAMFDTKNPAIPVYFAQPKINEDGELRYNYVFRMPKGKDCEDYAVSVNVYNKVKLSANPKSVYDKDCKVYFENLKYSTSDSEKISLTSDNVSELYGKDVNISFDIKGMGASILDTTIIAALKVDNRLQFAKILYDGTIEFEQSIPLDFDVNYAENAELEIYAWGSMDNILPLREVFTVKEIKKITLSLEESDEQVKDF